MCIKLLWRSHERVYVERLRHTHLYAIKRRGTDKYTYTFTYFFTLIGIYLTVNWFPAWVPSTCFSYKLIVRKTPLMVSTTSISVALIFIFLAFESSFFFFWPELQRPHEVKETEEVDEGKQSWESIVPPRDSGSRALGLFLWCWAWRRSGLSVRGCLWWQESWTEGQSCSKESCPPWCVYAPQVPQPKEELTL